MKKGVKTHQYFSGNLKRRKSGQIFCAEHITFSQETLWEHIFSICFPLVAFDHSLAIV